MSDDEQPRKPLSLREAKLVDAYLGEAKGNQKKAAELAGYHGNGHDLQTSASRALNRPHVQAELRERFAHIISIDESVGLLADIARGTEQDEVNTYDQRGNLVGTSYNRGDRIRALDIITKIQGLQKQDAQQVDVNVKAIIGIDLDKI